MKFMTALKLSFNNLRTKKGRTFLTAFASSIGIISIGIVLSLSSGFQKQIDSTQAETMAKYPITISKTTTDQTANRNQALGSEKASGASKENKNNIVAKISDEDKAQHTNKINQDYVDYINDIDPKLSNNIGFTRVVGMNLLRDVDGDVKPVKLSNEAPDSGPSMMSAMSSMTGMGVSSFPTQLDKNSGNFLEDNYKLLSGAYPKSDTDVVLIVDANNSTNINSLKNLGFDVKDGEKIDFDKIVGTEFKLINNNEYYTKLPTGNFIPNNDYKAMYDNGNNDTLKISGILRVKQSSMMNLLAPGIAYSNELTSKIVKDNENSEIVKAQKETDTNLMTND